MVERVEIEGKVGLFERLDGGSGALRLERHGGLVTQDAHGKYMEAVRRGSCFWAANTAATAVSVALATTYTGLVISNPAGSGKYMSLMQVGWVWTVAPAAIASIHIGAGYSAAGVVTHTTPLAVNNAIVGGSSGVGKADAAATIVNPLYAIPLIGGFTAAALPAQPNAMFDIDGGLILQPGAWAAIISLTATTGFGYMSWEEFTPP